MINDFFNWCVLVLEIIDGLNFTAAKYFDIRTNSWKLDKLVPSVLEANKLCREFSHKKL